MYSFISRERIAPAFAEPVAPLTVSAGGTATITGLWTQPEGNAMLTAGYLTGLTNDTAIGIGYNQSFQQTAHTDAEAVDPTFVDYQANYVNPSSSITDTVDEALPADFMLKFAYIGGANNPTVNSQNPPTATNTSLIYLQPVITVKNNGTTPITVDLSNSVFVFNDVPDAPATYADADSKGANSMTNTFGETGINPRFYIMNPTE